MYAQPEKFIIKFNQVLLIRAKNFIIEKNFVKRKLRNLLTFTDLMLQHNFEFFCEHGIYVFILYLLVNNYSSYLFNRIIRKLKVNGVFFASLIQTFFFFPIYNHSFLRVLKELGDAFLLFFNHFSFYHKIRKFSLCYVIGNH